MIASLLQNKHARWALYALVSAFSLSLFLKNAWAAEDAFIILLSSFAFTVKLSSLPLLLLVAFIVVEYLMKKKFLLLLDIWVKKK